MFYQIFISSQVKQCTIITYKYGIYKLTYKLPNYLNGRAFVATQEEKRPRIPGNHDTLGKYLEPIEW